MPHDPATTSPARRWRADSIAQADGSAVGSWSALAGGSSFAQSTAASRPTYRTNVINGKPVVRFDGNDRMSATVTAQAQPITISVVAKPITTTGNGMMFNAEGVELYFEGGTWTGWGGAALSGGAVSTAAVVLTWVANGTSSALYRNGSLIASGNGGTTGINTLTVDVGNYSAGGYPYNGDLAEVMVWHKALSTAERQVVHSYVQDYYGIAVADYQPLTQPAPQGSGSGGWAFAGTATGKRAPKASGSGAWQFAGTAAGSRPVVGGKSGTATGSWGYAGTATGKRAPKGTGAGAFTWQGTATGKRQARGAATGTWTYVGAASGSRPALAARTGTATGAWAYIGQATGTAAAVRPPSHTPAISTLTGTGQSTATLTGDGTSTALLLAAAGTATLHTT